MSISFDKVEKVAKSLVSHSPRALSRELCNHLHVCVCLFGCQQNCSETNGQIFMKFCGLIPRKNSIDFGDNLDHILDLSLDQNIWHW